MLMSVVTQYGILFAQHQEWFISNIMVMLPAITTTYMSRMLTSLLLLMWMPIGYLLPGQGLLKRMEALIKKDWIFMTG